jgi:hypothetical protein
MQIHCNEKPRHVAGLFDTYKMFILRRLILHQTPMWIWQE